MKKITRLDYWIIAFFIILFLPLTSLTYDWEFYETIPGDFDYQDGIRLVDVACYFKIEAIESDGKIRYLLKKVCSDDACSLMTGAEKEKRPVKTEIRIFTLDCASSRYKQHGIEFYGTDGTFLSSKSKEYGWYDIKKDSMEHYICEKYYSR
jgi:hypothetical protein